MQQARVEQKLGHDLTLAAGVIAPIAGDTGTTYDFAPPAGAGERSMSPAFEARLGFSRGTSDTSRELTIGVSGHYGTRRNITTAVTTDTWAAALDFNARVGRIGAAGEVFGADNAEPAAACRNRDARRAAGPRRALR